LASALAAVAAACAATIAALRWSPAADADRSLTCRSRVLAKPAKVAASA